MECKAMIHFYVLQNHLMNNEWGSSILLLWWASRPTFWVQTDRHSLLRLLSHEPNVKTIVIISWRLRSNDVHHVNASDGIIIETRDAFFKSLSHYKWSYYGVPHTLGDCLLLSLHEDTSTRETLINMCGDPLQ